MRASAGPARAGPWLLTAAAALLPSLLAYPWLTRDHDAATYGIIAQGIVQGEWPYSYAFDHKPVALYLPYAVALATVGTWHALRVLGIVLLLGIGILVHRLARRWGLTPWWAASAGAATTLGSLALGGLAPMSELVVNGYLLGAALVLARGGPLSPRRVGVVAALTALVLQTNYLALPQAGILVIAAGWRCPDRRRAVLVAAGSAAVVSALVLLPVLLLSDLGDYFRLQLGFLSGYGPTADGRVGADLGLPLPVRLGRALAVLAGPLVVCAVALVRRSRSGVPVPLRARLRAARVAGPAGDLPLLLTAALALAGLVAALANLRLFPHYQLLVVPWLCLALGLAVAGPAPGVRNPGDGPAGRVPGRRWLRRSAVAALVWLALLGPATQVEPLQLGVRGHVRELGLGTGWEDSTAAVVRATQALAPPGSVIFTESPWLYYYTGLRPATRFFFYDYHLDDATARSVGTTRAQQQQVVADARPVVVAVYPGVDATFIQDYLAAHCVEHARPAPAVVYRCPG